MKEVGLFFFSFFFFSLFFPPSDLLCLRSSRAKYNTSVINLYMFLDYLFFLHFDHAKKRKRLHIFDDVGVAAADFFSIF